MSQLIPRGRAGRRTMLALGVGLWLGVFATGCAEKLPESSLVDAIELEDLGRVHELLEQGADPDAPDAEGSPPLQVAAGLGFVDIALELLAYDASARSVDAKGQTPLHLARSGDGMPKLVRALLDRGALVNARDAGGRTPLAAHVDRHVAQLLISLGADVMSRDDEGKTPLHHAAGKQRGGTMVVLLANGADVNAVDHAGQTPMHVAALDPSTFLTFTLLKNGGDINAQDAEGFTPLHVAAERGKRRIVHQLLEAGADPDLTDAQGRTPLDLANAAERQPISRALEAWRGRDRRERALQQLEKEAAAAQAAAAGASTEGKPEARAAGS